MRSPVNFAMHGCQFGEPLTEIFQPDDLPPRLLVPVPTALNPSRVSQPK